MPHAAPAQRGAACPWGRPECRGLLLATEERRKQAGTQTEDMCVWRGGGRTWDPSCVHTPPLKRSSGISLRVSVCVWEKRYLALHDA